VISKPLRWFDRVRKSGNSFSLADDFPEPADELEAALMAGAGEYAEVIYVADPFGSIWALYVIGERRGVWNGKELYWEHADPILFKDQLNLFRGYRRFNQLCN